MMSKIIKSLNSINSFSKKVIMIGCIPVFTMCIAGMAIIGYNVFVAQEFDLYLIGSSMVSTSCVIFAQVVIASLVMDFMNTIIQNRD